MDYHALKDGKVDICIPTKFRKQHILNVTGYMLTINQNIYKIFKYTN